MNGKPSPGRRWRTAWDGAADIAEVRYIIIVLFLMLFGGGVTEEGRRAAAVSPRTLRRIIYWPRCFARNDYICKNSILLLNYPVKPFYKRNPSFKTLFRHVTSKSGGCLLFVLFWIHRLILDFYKGAVPPSPKSNVNNLRISGTIYKYQTLYSCKLRIDKWNSPQQSR